MMILGWIFSMGYRLEHDAERTKVLSSTSMPETPLDFSFSTELGYNTMVVMRLDYLVIIRLI